MLGFGVMIVNAYILYKTAYIIIRSKKKYEVLSQYEFRKEIALSRIKKIRQTWQKKTTTTRE